MTSVIDENKPIVDESPEGVTPTEMKAPKRFKKHTRFFDSYINKILKNISNNEITNNARQQLNSVIIHLARIFGEKALAMTEMCKKKTVSIREIQGVVNVVFTGQLKNLAIKEGNTAVESFEKWADESGEDKKTKSRQNKAGIIFPPSIVEKFIRNFNYSNIMVTNTAPVFLAAVLEYFTSQVLDAASAISTQNKKVRITVRDLELAVNGDAELKTIFTNNGLSFIGGGVVPFIHSNIIKKNPKGKANTALREIIRFQRAGDCIVFARHPFEVLVRDTCQNYRKDMKIAKEVFIFLQYYIEQQITRTLQLANNVAIHCKRLKVFPMDIEMVLSIRENRQPKFFDVDASSPETQEAIKIEMDKVVEEEGDIESVHEERDVESEDEDSASDSDDISDDE